MTISTSGVRQMTISTSRVVVALVTLIVWSGSAPPPASAQLLGSLIVNMSEPASGATVGGTVAVGARVTVVGLLTVRSVQFMLDGVPLGAEDTTAPYAVTWDTGIASNGAHTLNAVARDLLGLPWTSQAVTVTVFNDTTRPIVGIVSPAAGTTLSGTVTVNANSSDNVGIAGVQFRLDGANLGGEDTAAPYSISWNTLAASNGSH